MEQISAYLPILSIASIAVFFLCALAMHVLRPEIDPMRQGLSPYGTGYLSWLMNAAFVLLATGTAATSVSLASLPQRSDQLLTGLLFLGIACLGLLLVALCPSDGLSATTPRDRLHLAGALIYFAGAVTGTFIVSLALATNELKRVFPAAMVLSIIAVLVFFLTLLSKAGLIGNLGVFQRTLYVVLFLWVLLIAFRLMSIIG